VVTALERSSPDSTGDRNGKQVGVKKMEMTRSTGRVQNTYQIMNMMTTFAMALATTKWSQKRAETSRKWLMKTNHSLPFLGQNL
jgi:hypothetical protein